MLKKIAVIVLIIFMLLPVASAWSIFDEPVKEKTGPIHLYDVQTKWNFNDVGDYYWYWVEFTVDNITSGHDVKAVVSFYDDEGDLVKNENISAPIGKPVIYGTVEDNLTLDFDGIEYENSFQDYLFGGIDSKNRVEMDHIKIDIIDFTDHKLLYTTNESFNMDNFNVTDDDSDMDLSEDEDSDNENTVTDKSDADYEFFKESDADGNGWISYDELSDISFIFTEDSFWDGYSIEEIIQSEFSRANSDGDDYLTFDEFKEII